MRETQFCDFVFNMFERIVVKQIRSFFVQTNQSAKSGIPYRLILHRNTARNTMNMLPAKQIAVSQK